MVEGSSTSSVSPPSEYNPTVRFEVWLIQLRLYMKAKNITKDEDKVATLLQHIGLEMLEKIVDGTDPKCPEDMPYDDLLKIIQGHCSKKPNVLATRVKLFNERQQQGHLVQEYMSHMCQLLSQCEMKSMTPQFLEAWKAMNWEFLLEPGHDLNTVDATRKLAVSFEQSRLAAKIIKNQDDATFNERR